MNQDKNLPPELVEKMAEAWIKPNSVQECAQLAVDYCFETFVPLNQQLKDIKQQRDELINGIKEIKELILSIDGKHLSFDDLKHDILTEIKQLLKKDEDESDREIIESVINSHSPTEPEFDTLQNGDWFQGTEEEYRKVFELSGRNLSELAAYNAVGRGYVSFAEDSHGRPMITFGIKLTQLTPEEFLCRAENTFKTKQDEHKR